MKPQTIGGRKRNFEQSKELIELERTLREEKAQAVIELDEVQKAIRKIERVSEKIKELGIDSWREE